MKHLSNYIPSIDNLSYKVKDARNVVIGPVYSHLKEWEDIIDKRYPIAII